MGSIWNFNKLALGVLAEFPDELNVRTKDFTLNPISDYTEFMDEPLNINFKIVN